MEDNYKEIDSLSNELYKTIESLTIKLKDNSEYGKNLSKNVKAINQSLEDSISYFQALEGQSKQLANKLKLSGKNTNKDLIKIKEEELEFLEKLRKLIVKNKSYLSKSDVPLAILERLKDKKGFSTYKDKYNKRDDYNKNLYKYLSKTLDDLPKTKDTKKLQH